MQTIEYNVTHLADVFGPDGLFARSFSHYELRPNQLVMANIVSDAMRNHKRILIEAGTGTGKTLAYLTPLIYYNLRCLISTGTKNLQSQLLLKDIPQLERAFGRRIRAYSLKGRGNYICHRRWKRLITRPALNYSRLNNFIVGVKRWLHKTKGGERSELEWLSSEHEQYWSEVCSSTDYCQGQKCADFERCFVTRARQEAAGAEIVIVNHHLLMADCCLRQTARLSAIPKYSRLIIDEAHMLEQIATEYFGLYLSNRRIQELLRDTRRQMQESKIEDDDLGKILEKAQKKSFLFFESLQIIEDRFSVNDQTMDRSAREKLYSLILSLRILSGGIEKFAARCDAFINLSRRTKEISSAAEFILEHSDPEFVFWGERIRNNLTLKVSPIDISQQLAINLFKPLKGLVLTSATLSTNGGFDYIKSRLGINSEEERILESHFDYKKQAIIYIPKDMPTPTGENFLDEIAPRIEKILEITKGRALLLFTSYKNMNNVFDYLESRKPSFKLLKQGDKPQEILLREFSADISSVLLATSSFWQGIDVPGEALSCVIIDRLPFSVPTDPITEARIRLIRDKGGNPFWEFQLPSAIIILKQGLGRLIRHQDDHGLLVILDTRTCTKSYGEVILKDLPECPIIRSLEELADTDLVFPRTITPAKPAYVQEFENEL